MKQTRRKFGAAFKAPVAPKKSGRKPKTEKIDTLPKKTPSTDFQKLPASGKMETYNFNINGVTFTVSGKAKNVHKVPYTMVVNF